MTYTIYVDIECILIKHKTCSNGPNKSYSNTISTHIPSLYAINVVKQHKKKTIIRIIEVLIGIKNFIKNW